MRRNLGVIELFFAAILRNSRVAGQGAEGLQAALPECEGSTTIFA
jgi:hypothetical protein